MSAMSDQKPSGSYEASLKASYAESRARLFSAPPKARLARPRVVPPPEPIAAPVAPEPVRLRITACEEIEPWLPDRLPWKTIVREVAEKHKVTLADIIGPFRGRQFVAARHEAMYRLRHEALLSCPVIGRLIGKRDHTTVLNGIRRHAGILSGDVVPKARAPVDLSFWTQEKIKAAVLMRWRGCTFNRIAKLIGASSGSAVRKKLDKIGSLDAIEAAERMWRR